MLSYFGLAITVRGVVDKFFFQVFGTLGYVAPEYPCRWYASNTRLSFQIMFMAYLLPKKSHPRKIDIININFLCYNCPHDIDSPLLR